MHEGAQVAKVVLEPLDIGPKFLAVLGQLLYREVLSLDLRFLYLVTLTEHRVEAHYFQLVLQGIDSAQCLIKIPFHDRYLLLRANAKLFNLLSPSDLRPRLRFNRGDIDALYPRDAVLAIDIHLHRGRYLLQEINAALLLY